MPKKSTKAPEVAVKEGKQPATKKPRNEIDDIFAGKKRKKADKDNVKKDRDVDSIAADGVKEKKKTKKSAKDFDKNTEIKENVGGGSRERKRTGDGLTIYTEEELGIASRDAGTTPLCPFDCDCCF